MATTVHDTIPRQFLASVEGYHRPDAFRHKIAGSYRDISHGEVYARVSALACALRALGVGKRDRVALLSENRIEWVIADLATLSCGGVSVPLYATLPANQIEYMLRDSEARIVFVSSSAQLAKIESIRGRLPELKHVIVFDADTTDDGALSLEAVVSDGRALAAEADFRSMVNDVSTSDWASIIYTSGTTGEPKGAILSHGNFMSNVRQSLEVFDIGPSDVCLSFLPLSHVFERMAGYYTMMTAGVSIAYAESIETVPENLREVSPTIVCSVPRVYEKMYARVLDSVAKSPPLRRALFWWAIGVGKAHLAASLAGGAGPFLSAQRRLARSLVFKKLEARVGGKLRFFVSGGAPLAREIAEFFNGAGVRIMEGYGLTETSPVVALNTFENFRIGTVGKPVPGVEVRIADDGEVLVRGDNVMQGYFKKPEATAEAMAGGWFHTGDIGHLDPDGFLVITDRKKDLIATAGGKKVAPQPIEGRLKQHPLIAEAVLVGDRRPFITTLIVPNFERLSHWAAEHGIPHDDRGRLVDAPAVRQLYQKIVDGVNADLAQYERAKGFTLLKDELTIDAGHLTPTLKVRRRIVEKTYRNEIEAMYQSGAAAHTATEVGG
ncbi:MAG TPA: long-chain fatty acid--CoA ligase [Candidatus Krumholzibacteria bacterium]|nr:long-chain fatty acid--CoA ligase [Candidatus Krumholzibacteria bacterium]